METIYVSSAHACYDNFLCKSRHSIKDKEMATLQTNTRFHEKKLFQKLNFLCELFSLKDDSLNVHRNTHQGFLTIFA